MLTALVGFLNYAAADRIKRFRKGSHDVLIRACNDQIAPGCDEIHTDGERSHRLVPFLCHRNLARSDLVVELCEPFELFIHSRFNGGRAIDAMKDDLSGHIGTSLLVIVFCRRWNRIACVMRSFLLL